MTGSRKRGHNTKPPVPPVTSLMSYSHCLLQMSARVYSSHSFIPKQCPNAERRGKARVAALRALKPTDP